MSDDELVTIQVPVSELAFMRGFDPDRDRVSTRRDVVAVIEHWQEVLAEAAERAAASQPPWLCRVILGMEHIDAPCSGLHPVPLLGTSLARAGLKYQISAPVLDSLCQICARPVARQNAQAIRWVHVGIQDGELDHGAIPRWDRERA